MRGITIELMKQHSSTSYRLFNRVELFVSFEGVLTLVLNGKVTHFYHQVAIVNPNDIVKVKAAQAVAKISIPLHYFSKYEPQYLQGYFNYHKLSSHNKIKTQIKQIIAETNTKKHYDLFTVIIKTLLSECFILTGTTYVPRIQVKSILFNNIMDYVHEKPYARVSLQELSEHFFVSESYISTLFNKFLDYNFKKYFVSLKIGLSIYQLLTTNESINQIALHYQFSSYNHYSKQFKRFIGISPISFRKQIQQYDTSVTIEPFDHQYFEGHLTYSKDKPNTQKFISIYFNQIRKTQEIPAKTVFLEVEKMDEISQIFAREQAHHVQPIKNHMLYFNSASNQPIVFERMEEIELLSELINKHHYQVAYHLTSMPCYETFKTHFFYPLLDVIEQSMAHPASFKLNLVLEDATLSEQDLQFIMHEMKTLYAPCQFTLNVPVLFPKKALSKYKSRRAHNIKYDYYMMDMLEIYHSQPMPLAKGYAGSPFHQQFNQWIESVAWENQPILLSGLIDWMTTQPHHILHTDQFLDIVLKMHPAIKGFTLPFIGKNSEALGYYTALGHQTALQHVYHLMRPFNNATCAIGTHYIMHESPTAYDILLFHPLQYENHPTSLTYALYGTLELQQHFVVAYTYHPQYSNIDQILNKKIQDYYLPAHYQAKIHSTNQLLFSMQLHHFGQSRYLTTLLAGEIRFIHISKTPSHPQSDILKK
ncbi:helix-turn-helix domain-containing protein [Staphylococcus lutrae]|uniref:AraC family transcriptional regulator n=1 Tax=Staphylococcus lutrae TaxID=155085 RepID=A0AAC9RSU7_9STAP|nr:helix-turn-helix domain-containing protein [Staphylococcus lutrae]ARJ50529.1 AraC family transcriptional regulator [Staphylococcus lutrae]PNZ37431.1 AraC family transcriptional regulator [Staphylococcus lutrae]